MLVTVAGRLLCALVGATSTRDPLFLFIALQTKKMIKAGIPTTQAIPQVVQQTIVRRSKRDVAITAPACGVTCVTL